MFFLGDFDGRSPVGDAEGAGEADRRAARDSSQDAGQDGPDNGAEDGTLAGDELEVVLGDNSKFHS